jgi:hypothetical protein
MLHFRGRVGKNIGMDDKDRYTPDVYRRLKLVEKQFEANKGELRKQQTAERQRERKEKVISTLGQNKLKIGRIAAYAVVGAILLAVIIVAIRGGGFVNYSPVIVMAVFCVILFTNYYTSMVSSTNRLHLTFNPLPEGRGEPEREVLHRYPVVADAFGEFLFVHVLQQRQHILAAALEHIPHLGHGDLAVLLDDGQDFSRHFVISGG